MRFISVALLAVFGLASIHCSEKQNFGEFAENVYKLDKLLHKTIDNYNAHGYHTFANLSKQFVLSDHNKDWIGTLPKNVSIDANDKVKVAYNTLKYYEILYQSVIFPVRMSDAFKGGVLAHAVNPKTGIDENLKAKVVKIIHEEALIGRDFSKPSPNLESLYAELEDVPQKDIMDTMFLGRFVAQLFVNHCQLLGAQPPCNVNLRALLNQFLAIDKQIHLQTPIDSEAKVSKLLSYLTAYLNVREKIEKAVTENGVYCTPSGCFKFSLPTQVPTTGSAFFQ